MSLLVKEIYPAILGESALSGFPCLIIRLSGCNLRCGYCDSSYAWRGGKRRGIDEILRIVSRKGYKRVLLTGGEPLIQEESFRLMEELVQKGQEVLLETNGSLSISGVAREVHIIMDIKTPGSGYESANFYQNLELLKKRDELKFVLTSEADYEWAKEMVLEFELDRRFLVNFSPAFGILDSARLARWMVRDRIDVRLNLQLHRIIFPEKERGV